MSREPKNYLGIMVSSTFTDLETHREEVRTAISRLGFMPVVMEHSGATPADVVSQSLNMVRDCAAYVLLISHKYGQTPNDKSNPDGLSITELEFNEAVRLSRPRLLFVMSDDHPITKAQVEVDADKRAKLDAFKRRAKLVNPADPDSDLACIYEQFSSPDDLGKRASAAIARLIEHLPRHSSATITAPTPASTEPPPIPRPSPPALRSVPPYGTLHKFVGRRAELETLDDWASPNDPHPILLFEAIGGAGKSRLTWHWLNAIDGSTASQWSGRFWYSFYEQGATLSEFCCQALNYFTGFPVETFRKMQGSELSERLLAALNNGRWLVVLDGIERILVGYQRLDAPQVRDENAEALDDPIADRDPCRSVWPDDDKLLFKLAQVSGSKILVSSRLNPAAFTNGSGAGIPGVRRELLKGLRPADAVKLFHDCGVEGPTQDIQTFLQANCDGHPLTVGALAGLVNAYPPDHGNFIKWRDDPRHGGALNLANCDLVQRRNHILDAAIAALAPKTREVLQALAILRGGGDYDLLLAINPFLPPSPEKVDEPEHPESLFYWKYAQADEDWRQERLRKYDSECGVYRAYLAELAVWEADPRVCAAPGQLDEALADLERRGLLQFDRSTRRYDLHPVVRGVASGRLKVDDVVISGSRLVDYCQAKSPKHWDDAKTEADVELGLQAVAALIRMGRFQAAFHAFEGSLANALWFNLENVDQFHRIMRSFFPKGWDREPVLTDEREQSCLLTYASSVVRTFNRDRAIGMLERAIKLDLRADNQILVTNIVSNIHNISQHLPIPAAERLLALSLDLAKTSRDGRQIFTGLLCNAMVAAEIGRFDKAAKLFSELAQRLPPDDRSIYRPGTLELWWAYFQFCSGKLTDDVLSAGENISRAGNHRTGVREFACLRGRWLIENSQPAAAIPPLQIATSMSRDIGIEDELAEAALALARVRNGDHDLETDSIRWDNFGKTAALYVGWLWLERGKRDRAIAAARRAYSDAHDPGEPYVNRWGADRARALLIELGETPPEIPPYDPSSDPAFSWEADVRALIEKIEAKRRADDERERAEAEHDPE